MYTLQRHPFDYTVGEDKYGNQVIIGLLYPYIGAALFDVLGAFIELRIRSVVFRAKSIHKDGPYLIEEPEFGEKLQAQIGLWQLDLGYRERSICIEQFRLEEFSIGIEDLPGHFQKFRAIPNEFTEEEKREFPQLIDTWISEGNFVLWWGKDYYINKEGETV